MKAAFVIFDQMTSLDFVGVFDPLGRLKTMGFVPDFDWSICALTPYIKDDRGLTFMADSICQSLEGFDLLIVPGGYGTRRLLADEHFLRWLKTGQNIPLKASVCTGALLFGALGILHNRRATTHPTAINDLREYCGNVCLERIVDDGDIISAGGVTASIDLGLHLVERIAGASARQQIAKQMDYHISVAKIG
jgi:cyclohexyl-isocyanide hydratase